MYKSRKLKKRRPLKLMLTLLSGLLAISNYQSSYAQDVKVGVIEENYCPYTKHNKSRLTESTDDAYVDRDIIQVVNDAADPSLGGHHGNHVVSKIMELAPKAKMRVVDLQNERSLRSIVDLDEKLAKSIEQAVLSKAKFLNISRRLTVGDNWNGEIKPCVRNALLKARDAGISVIKSAGNDGEHLGQTAYTSSLLQLLKDMNGSMIMVVALDRDQEDLAWRFSNKAGMSEIASKYIVAAPGESIVANGAGDMPITMSGTSMAAPFITGIAACIMEEYKFSSQDALKCVLDSATIENEFQRRLFGRGIVTKEGALKLAKDRAENGENLRDTQIPAIWEWGVELEPSQEMLDRLKAKKPTKDDGA